MSLLTLADGGALAQSAPSEPPATERPRFGVGIGLNIATVSYGGYREGFLVSRKIGLTVGALVRWRVSPALSIETGAMLSQKGATYEGHSALAPAEVPRAVVVSRLGGGWRS